MQIYCLAYQQFLYFRVDFLFDHRVDSLIFFVNVYDICLRIRPRYQSGRGSLAGWFFRAARFEP